MQPHPRQRGFTFLDLLLVLVLMVAGAIISIFLAGAESARQARQAQQAWDGLAQIQRLVREGRALDVSEAIGQVRNAAALPWSIDAGSDRQRVRLSGVDPATCSLLVQRLSARAAALVVNQDPATDVRHAVGACRQRDKASIELDLALAGDLRAFPAASTPRAASWNSETGF